MRAFSICLIAVLVLSGCRSIWDPTFQPAGYSYHRNEFKSPPGPPADDIGYGYTAAKNDQVLNEWRYALRDLLQKAPAYPHDLVLVTDLAPSAFQGTYDSLLREGLRANGYHLIKEDEASADTPRLFYSAYGAKAVRQLARGNAPHYNGDPQLPDDPHFTPAHQNLELVIGLIEEGNLTGKLSGLYPLQAYGQKAGIQSFLPGHERPLAISPATENAP